MDRDQNLEKASFELIAASGAARSIALEAIKTAREGDIPGAKAKLDESQETFAAAHEVQHAVMDLEALEERVSVDPLFVHAQTHVMSCLVTQDLAEEFVALYEKINA